MELQKQELQVDAVLAEVAQPVLRYLEHYVGDRTLAEDLRQETLARVAQGLPAFAGRSSVRTWAFSIASRVAADHFRRPEQRARIVELEEVGETADPERAIGERMVVDEMNHCVRQVIDSLPDGYRAALVLYELEELTLEQTAEACECTPAAAKIRIHRARRRLREALEKQCEFYRDGDGIYRCDRKA